MLADTRDNLAAVGYPLDSGHLKQASILKISAPESYDVLVTNPPYGVRTGECQSLTKLYPKMGDIVKKKFTNWNAYIFSADPGALECYLFE